MWTSSICFPHTVSEQDDEGFPVDTITDGEGIKASCTSTTRADETLANSRGYTADIVVKIAACNYHNQGYFKDRKTGDTYDIKRVYQPEKSKMILLTGELRKNGKS